MKDESIQAHGLRFKKQEAVANFDDHTIDIVLRRLNEMLEADPAAMAALVIHRVPCADALADHETAQVGADGIGLLGVLNGIAGKHPDGMGLIAAEVADDSVTVERFIRTRYDWPADKPIGVTVDGNAPVYDMGDGTVSTRPRASDPTD